MLNNDERQRAFCTGFPHELRTSVFRSIFYIALRIQNEMKHVTTISP